MTLEEYKKLQDFLKQSCGIILGTGKQYLVKNRLDGVLKEFDFKSFSDLLGILQTTSIQSKRLSIRVVDAMTTNETFWFREQAHFSELKDKLFPELMQTRRGHIKVWSAACSTGQEPYNISICAEDFLRSNTMYRSNNVQIIGTDISETAIEEAKNAEYSELALSRGLDQNTRSRFFHQTQTGFKLNPEITRRVRFQQFNLLNPLAVLGKFDIIFCRNVLIYFSEDVKQDILTRMAEMLEPGGYLFLSGIESMPVNLKMFEVVKGSSCRYYQNV